MSRQDFYVVTLIGFLVGFLALPIAVNFDLRLSVYSVFGLIAGFAFLGPAALFTLYRFRRFWRAMDQFARYAAVGTLGFFLDLSILNFLIYSSGISNGVYFSIFVGIAFIIATTNNYFWNRIWTFKSRSAAVLPEYFRFVVFTFVGFLIHVSVASFVNNVIGPPSGFDPRLWANISAVIAVFSSMAWNFTSYRYLVFKESRLAEFMPEIRFVKKEDAFRPK